MASPGEKLNVGRENVKSVRRQKRIRRLTPFTSSTDESDLPEDVFLDEESNETDDLNQDSGLQDADKNVRENSADCKVFDQKFSSTGPDNYVRDETNSKSCSETNCFIQLSDKIDCNEQPKTLIEVDAEISISGTGENLKPHDKESKSDSETHENFNRKKSVLKKSRSYEMNRGHYSKNVHYEFRSRKRRPYSNNYSDM